MSNPTKAKRKGEEEEPAASEKKAKLPASASAAVAAEPIVRTTPTTLAIRRKLDAALNEAGGSGSLPVPDLINIIEAYYGNVFCGIPGVQADVRMGQSDALRGPTTVLALPAGSPFNAQHKDAPSLMIIDNDGMCTRQYYIGQDASTTTCELYSSLALSAALHGHVRRRHCRASCMCVDPSSPNRLFVGHSTGMDVVTVDVQSSKLTAECIADRPGIKSVIASLDGKKTFVADVCGQMFRIDVNLRDPIQLADDAYSLCWAVGPTVPPETMVYLTATGVICFFDVKSGILSHPLLHLADRHEGDSSEVFDPTTIRGRELACTNGGYLLISSRHTCDLYAMEVLTGAVTFLSKTGEKRQQSGARFVQKARFAPESELAFGSGMAIVETDRSIAIVDRYDHCIRRVPLPSHMLAAVKPAV